MSPSCARWELSRCSLAEALRFIRERVESLQVAPERPRPGHLYACRLQQAAYSGRAHLYVVGLEEGRVFPSRQKIQCLLDGERAAISPELRLSTDRIDEAVYATLARLAAWNAGPRPASRARQAHIQLLVPRHPRVPRDLCIVADAAGVPAAAGRSSAVVSST